MKKMVKRFTYGIVAGIGLYVFQEIVIVLILIGLLVGGYVKTKETPKYPS